MSTSDSVHSPARRAADTADTGDAAPRRSTGQVQGSSTARALQVLGLGSLAFSLSTETIPLVLEFLAASPGAALGTALLLASQLYTAVALFLPRHHLASAWAMLALLLGGIALMARQAGTFDLADYLLPGYWAFPIVALAMRSARHRDHLVFAGVAAVAMMLVQHAYVGTSTWEDLADHLWILQPIALVLLFGNAIIAIDEAREDAVARSLTARAAKSEAEDQEQGRVEARRLLDEQVLPALEQVAAGGSTRRTVDICRDARSAVQDATGRRRTTRVEDLLATIPALVRAGVVVDGATAPAPMAMALAMGEATRELLADELARGGSKARIRVEEDDDQREVHIVDPRRGNRPLDRLGRDRRVFELMDGIGGEVVVTPGAEGEVLLRWPRQESTSRGTAWREAPDQLVRSRLTRTAWPMLATSFFMTLLAAGQVERPGLGLAVGLATLAIGVVAAVVLRHRALRPWALGLIFVVAVVAWFVNLSLVPTPPEIDYPLWMAWTASALIHLVVLSGRLRTGAVLTLLWAVIQVVSLAVHFGDWLEPWWHSFVIMTGAGDVFITLMVLWVARSSAAQEAEATEIASRLRAAATRLQMNASLSRHWKPLVSAEALPLVDRVASGSVDADDPAVVGQARELAGALRTGRPEARR